MTKMSSKLIFSAAASTLAMAAFAVGAPSVEHRVRHGASSSPITAGLPAPARSLPFSIRR